MGGERFLAVFCASLLFCVPLVSAPLAEPAPVGKLLLPGRLVFGLSALPTGELLAPCEDQTLSVLDGQANVLTTWQAPARFAGPVTVAPRGPLQLLAAPLLSGRVEVLAYDPVSVALASQFALTHPAAPSTPTVWDSAGRLYQAWKDGHLEAWNSHGTELWSRDLAFTPLQLLNDDSQGLFLAGTSILTLIDRSGVQQKQWAVDGTPRGLLQTLAGNLYLWTETGLWVLDASLEALRKIDSAASILGVTTDRQNHLLVTEPQRWRLLGPGGSVILQAALTRLATGEAVVDDRGRLYVPTQSAVEAWAYDGHFIASLASEGQGPPTTAPLITEKGLLAWSGDDWVVRIWNGAAFPPFAWPESGGGPRRSWSTTRPPALVARMENWASQPEFNYFLELASSGDDAKQQKVLTMLEEKDAAGTLLQTWPFANTILLKILRSGLTDLIIDHNYITNNWPSNRLRAYHLLARTATPEDREELLSLLDKEFDPVNLAQGARVLAETGWDGDGRLMRMLAGLQYRKPQEAVIADAVVDSAYLLWSSGNASSDPSLVSLLSTIYQGDYPRSVRLKAQKFFQDILDRN